MRRSLSKFGTSLGRETLSGRDRSNTGRTRKPDGTIWRSESRRHCCRALAGACSARAVAWPRWIRMLPATDPPRRRRHRSNPSLALFSNLRPVRFVPLSLHRIRRGPLLLWLGSIQQQRSNSHQMIH